MKRMGEYRHKLNLKVRALYLLKGADNLFYYAGGRKYKVAMPDFYSEWELVND